MQKKSKQCWQSSCCSLSNIWTRSLQLQQRIKINNTSFT